MNRKRSIQIAVVAVIVIVVVIVVLCMRGCRGGPKGPPIVIEVSIRTSDELAISVHVNRVASLADDVFTDPDVPGQLFMGPELIAAIAKGVGDHSVELSEGVNSLEDIGAIIIERITYDGQGRQGVIKRIRLVAELPDPTRRKTPDKVVVGVDDSNIVLYDVLPWPEGISWTLIGDDKLKVVSGETAVELGVGQSGEIASLTVEIPVSIEEIDDTADIPDGDDVELPTVTRDLGKVKFTAVISVRYLGRLEITEDEQ